MGFTRQSMENILDKMISWTQGVSTKLTDFRVGSKVRTIYEAVALIVEEQYDKVYKALKEIIESNMYAMLSFDKIPAVYASGQVTFARAKVADKAYYIAAGTMLQSTATATTAPIKFYTAADAIIQAGASSVKVTVICTISGTTGNVPAGSIVTFIQKPAGIDSVTNELEFTNGAEEETKDAQKSRFQAFIQAQARGVLQSIEYGAKQAKIVDTSTGVSITKEAVLAAKATEDTLNNKGVVTLYIWNGVGPVSSDLIAMVTKILLGYTADDGTVVYGYKTAGILVNILAASVISTKVKLQIVTDSTTTLAALQPQISTVITNYYKALGFGDTAVQSALQAKIKNIGSIADAKLYFSTDGGTTWSMDNVVPSSTQIVALVAPIIYA